MELTQSDLARHFHVSRQAVNNWTKRPGFPAPEKSGRYNLSRVVNWLEESKSPALTQSASAS